MAGWWDRPEWAKLGTERADEVIRRDFLARMLALGALGWGPRHAEAAAFVQRPVPGPRLVSWLEGITLELAAQWDDGQPVRLQRRLLGFYTVLAELAETSPLAHKRDVCQLAGRNAALLGLMTRVTGQGERALQHLVAADVFAIEASDEGLRTLIAVWRSDCDSAVQSGIAGPSHQWVRDQLNFADEHSAAAPPAVRALALLRKAEEHAAAGEIVHAYRALDRAEVADAQLTDREQGLYGISWSQAVMKAFRANVSILCGDPAAAVPILEAVIPHAASTSNRVAAVTDLASACARLGEVERAAELLTEALEGARAGGLQERARRVVGVRERDLGEYGDLPAVRRLDETILAR